MDDIKRISLWSGPRNISTTMMYSFAQRSDTKVVDEPLYAHYLSKTDAKQYHPEANQILKEQNKNGNEVLNNLISNNESPVYFYKQMTHHLLQINKQILSNFYNIILTRDPVEMLPSFDKIISKPKMNDVGYQTQVDLLNFCVEHKLFVHVIDAKQVLLNPSQELKKICKQVGISYEEQMLSWPKGPRNEDGVWAKYWYKNIHNSTGFKPYKEKTEKFPEHLKPLLLKCQPLYKQLINYTS